MLIEKIAVKNFKSLVDFEATLAPFSCLIGLNGAGKSTVLQFLDFLGQVMRGNITLWLQDRRWRQSELTSKLQSHETGLPSGAETIDFHIELRDGDRPISWSASFIVGAELYCVEEHIVTHDADLKVRKGELTINPISHDAGATFTQIHETISFEYQGSVLSALRPDRIPKSLSELRSSLRELRSLDSLEPDLLRAPSRGSEEQLVRGGKNLGSVLNKLDSQSREKLERLLKTIQPRFKGWSTSLTTGDLHQLFLFETHGGNDLSSRSPHVNDGMLRLLALLASTSSRNESFVVFDEIENGISPEVIQFLVSQLVASEKQVVVTTHSPLILNYLTDDVARRGVFYIYKDAEGGSKSVPFFSIPSIAEKLKVMGPGEAFADTSLSQLDEELAAMNGAK